VISTEAFRERWRSLFTRQCVALARIEITSPDALTIYAATDEVTTPDGQHWEPILCKEIAITSPGGFLGTDVPLASASFRILDKRASFVGDDEVVSSVIANYDLQGARVTLILWECGLADWEDRLERFVGVVQTYKTKNAVIYFTAIQPVDWNRDVTPRRITMQEYPQAPEEAIGAALPTILGRIPGLPMRRPFAAEFSNLQHGREHMAGGARVAAGVLVDTGRGGGGTNPKAKVLFAGHRCNQIGGGGGIYGTTIYLEGKEGLPHVMDVALADVINEDSGAGCYVPDGTGTAFAPVYPIDIRVTTNYADNPRAVLDRFNECVFARLNYSASQRALIVKLPSVPDPGRFVQAYAYLFYRSSATLTGAEFKSQNVVVGGLPASTASIPASVTESFVSILLGTAWASGSLPDQPWDFSEVELSVGFAGGGPAGSIEVIAMGITAEYVPAQEVLSLEKRLETVPIQSPRRDRGGRHRHRSHVYSPSDSATREVLTSITELRGRFYANVYGMPDDGLGTYTANPLSVIERPPDVAQFILERFAGVLGTGIERTLGEFGSFASARALLRTPSSRDMILGLHLSESVNVQTVLGWIMAASASSIVLSEFTGRWEFHPWLPGPEVTYTIPVSFEDLVDPNAVVEVELTPLGNVLSGVRILYGYDALTKTFPLECAISGDRSMAGHAYRNLRDAFLSVSAGVNDKIDTYQTSGGAITTTIAPGDYTPASFVSALKAALPGDGQNVAFGGVIVAGVNDILVINDGSYRGVTLTPGTYTMEALADHLAAQIATVSAGWVVYYTRSTRKFTFQRSYGTAGLAFSSGRAQTCAAVVGFGIRDLSGSLTYTSDGICEEGLVAIAKDREFDLRWRTGTNGLLGTKQTASEVLGFDFRNDDVGIGKGATGYRHVGYCPKSNLEASILAVDQRLGKRAEFPVDGRALYDTATVLELRNRLVALLGSPRGVVTFTTLSHPDLRRGDVFEFNGDMDRWKPYAVPGSDGLWAGRRFRTLETHQRAGDSWHTEIVAVDVTA
jgi:hypothetical protein